MEAFQLRLWDGRLGRWLSPDPYGQYSSPYLGMGNNPIGLIDPDGGFTEGCCPDPVPTKLNEVIVFSGHAKNYLADFSQKFVAAFAGFGNAFGSNMILGGGRFNAERWSNASTRMSYRYGQLAGDISSMVWGAGEMAVGGTMAAGGVVLVPLTGGFSLAGTAAGSAIAAHGTSVIVLGGLNTAKDIQDLSDSFAKDKHGSGGSSSKNAQKMDLDEIENFLGKNWHQNGAKTKFLNQFKKELRGDTNADFYVDKLTNEVLLKSNKSGNWIHTGHFLN